MKQDSEEFRNLDRLARLSPHNDYLGLHLESVQGDTLTCDIALREEFIGNPEGSLLHGGVVTAMLDATCGLAVIVKLGKLTRIATLDLRIDYLKPTSCAGSLYSRCSCYKLTKQVAFVQGTAFIRNTAGEEDEIAKASGTFMVLQARGG